MITARSPVFNLVAKASYEDIEAIVDLVGASGVDKALVDGVVDSIGSEVVVVSD